ncbi:MAG: glycogen/starch synthase, partial [Candidatus Methanomethylicus sp.]|nr:glycogen/starch synthase [Candidatus Methanomethylicus sp.]
MDIALFTWEYPPKIVGGLGTYTYELSKQLAKMGHCVDVFTMNDGNLKTIENFEGIEVHRPRLFDISAIFPEVVDEEIRRWGPGLKFFSNVYLYNLLVTDRLMNDLIPSGKKHYDILSVHDW